MTSLKLGLVINPIAGVGAALAWKGTDNVNAAWKAIADGEKQPVWELVNRALASIPNHIEIQWLLGGDYPIMISGEICYQLPEQSQPEDTRKAVETIEKLKPDLIIFAGGDGTAADVAQSTKIPMIGIPAGVKIFSPCFLHRPEDLGTMLLHWEGELIEVDLLDLDEDAYRQGRAEPKLITNATIPVSPNIQSGKISWTSPATRTFELIAERIRDENWFEGNILVGPGSTMKNIMAKLGLEVSLLGVDLVTPNEVLILDGTASQLEQQQIDQIWLSPIGNQGHIFGRGNRQITPKIIAAVGKQHVKIFATQQKARETKVLYVDTGNSELDQHFRGYISVIVGYHDEIIKKVL